MNIRATIAEKRERERKEHEAEMRKRNIDFISNPDMWPRWPILPLKKYATEVGAPLPPTGVVLADKPTTVVVDVNLWSFPKSKVEWEKHEHKHYQSIEEMVDDGWVVD